MMLVTTVTARRELYVSAVQHEATVTLDWHGTEAAAAAAAVISGTSSPGGQPVRLSIDRPFVFLVRDSETGAILFMGRVVNPQN